MSPSAIPLATRFAALIPTRRCPRITATRLRHVWPLIVTVIGGRGPERMASTTPFGTSTPVALPEGMTLALNFMFVSSSRPVATPGSHAPHARRHGGHRPLPSTLLARSRVDDRPDLD